MLVTVPEPYEHMKDFWIIPFDHVHVPDFARHRASVRFILRIFSDVGAFDCLAHATTGVVPDASKTIMELLPCQFLMLTLKYM